MKISQPESVLEKGEAGQIIGGGVALVVMGYLFFCLMFCAQAGTEWQGAYNPIWHWPIKVLHYFM